MSNKVFSMTYGICTIISGQDARKRSSVDKDFKRCEDAPSSAYNYYVDVKNCEYYACEKLAKRNSYY
jgi:hypothetical protein